MDDKVMQQTALGIRNHVARHGGSKAFIFFHGGEPLLAGYDRIRNWLTILYDTFEGSGIALHVGMQTNGLLLDEKFCQLFLDCQIKIGVSVDGIPGIGDLLRVDHRGKPMGKKLEEKLRLLSSDKYNPIFSGILSVINVALDPVATVDYLASFRPHGIDFLLPLDNHDRLPPGKQSFQSSEYGTWLAKAFSHILDNDLQVEVRTFSSIVQTLLGNHAAISGLGVNEMDTAIVETDGAIELLDTIKAAKADSTKLGCHVMTHAFDDAWQVLSRTIHDWHLDRISNECKQCPFLQNCGAGKIPHRYSKERQFDQPTVYCNDMKHLITHIRDELIK
jgi:uncharacterized protein